MSRSAQPVIREREAQPVIQAKMLQDQLMSESKIVNHRLLIAINQFVAEANTQQLNKSLTFRLGKGEDAGANAFYLLMSTLNLGVVFKLSDVEHVISTISNIINKCDPTMLMRSLLKIKTVNDSDDFNALSYLIDSFEEAIKNKSSQVGKIADLIIKIIAVMYKQDLNTNGNLNNNFNSHLKALFNNQTVLARSIIKYIMNSHVDKVGFLTKLVGNETLLGQLIDHQQGFFKRDTAEARKQINRLLADKWQEFSREVESAMQHEVDVKDKDVAKDEQLDELSYKNSTATIDDKFTNKADEKILEKPYEGPMALVKFFQSSYRPDSKRVIEELDAEIAVVRAFYNGSK